MGGGVSTYASKEEALADGKTQQEINEYLKKFTINNEILNVNWFEEKMGQKISNVTIREQEKIGGVSGTMNFFNVTFKESSETKAIVIKSAAPNTPPHRPTMGLGREGFFYNELATELSTKFPNLIPKHFYATGSMEDGSMVIILEAKENAVPGGTFFGPGNPGNWAIRDKLEEMSKGNPSALEICNKTFDYYAKIHSAYWKSSTLLEKKWLKGASWIQGQEKEKWEGFQGMAAGMWKMHKDLIAKGEPKIKWNAHLVKCIDAAMSKTKWETYITEFNVSKTFTLVHGDAHPHNTLWVNQRSENATLALIDFEFIGVGSPSQELGQFMVLLEPEKRRANEKKMVDEYYKKLIDNLKALNGDDFDPGYTIEECWDEYVKGCAGKVAWIIPIFAMRMPAAGQFYHDMLAGFLEDHIKNPEEDMPMVRV